MATTIYCPVCTMRVIPSGTASSTGRAGDLDLEKCRKGGFGGGFFAVWCSNDPSRSPDPAATFREFPAIDVAGARLDVTRQIATLIRLTSAHPHAIRLCRTAPEIEAARAAGAIAALLHIEGCEAIGADLDALYLYHAAGLRSLGPVWSCPNIFAHGVPFNHPASPDIGPGLTDAGKELLRACNQMKILFDLSHLNEAGFWDVAKLSTKPLVATHSNAHAVTASTRNLTDRQLAAIAESRRPCRGEFRLPIPAPGRDQTQRYPAQRCFAPPRLSDRQTRGNGCRSWL
ncbi:MAG: membrane dipeptidase [Cypionkella sp.]